MTITVTIVTPCYNGARFIGSTLASALAQTHCPLEIIVVDDGSTDQSAAIAESLGPPVRVIRQANQGESVARNRALDEARGTHVLFLDADDLLEPWALERLVEALTPSPDAVAIMGCAWFSENPREPYAVRLPEVESFYPAIIQGNLAPPHCWLAPVSLVQKAGGFFGDLRWFEDWDLWWRVGLDAPALIRVPHVGALYRRHPHSQLATTKLADQARGHAVLMARMVDAFLSRPRMLETYGDQLFWSAFTALRRARAQGVGWAELSALEHGVGRLAGSAAGRSKLAWLMRTIGVRTATRLYATVNR